MTERELKPCPFCGGDGHVAYRGDHFVTCRECKAFGPDAESDETAIALWNRRTTPDREAIIEECAKVCDEITRHHYPPQKISGFCASAIRAQKTAPNGEKGPPTIKLAHYDAFDDAEKIVKKEVEVFKRMMNGEKK